MLRPDQGPDISIPEIRLPPSLVARANIEGTTAGGGGTGRRVAAARGAQQQNGSPLVKADAVGGEISDAMKSPMRGATL